LGGHEAEESWVFQEVRRFRADQLIRESDAAEGDLRIIKAIGKAGHENTTFSGVRNHELAVLMGYETLFD
jgi:hypothetical protein